ncbi:hypothetical protein D6C91_07550 [Aureobasidium pullulans]|uniref:Extracellular membrane protein CFEM domain-containing protein n=1 Tax=Aureobasidium pullulans TaxID=5580 RepID=A0A4S9SQX7_AURPU|nr:hypothetical protein D6C91_07550 [Aureobasidium pullulans]
MKVIMICKNTILGGLAVLSAVARAQQDDYPFASSIFDRVNPPFTFTGCAAPSEMQTCWESQNYDNEYLNPLCTGLQNRVQCALTNCWNRVYSCDYQQLMVAYNTSCSDEATLSLPFFPPPADAAEVCSCNLNNVVNDFEKASSGWPRCVQKVQDENGITDDDDSGEDFPTPGCDCCYYGVVAAAMYDTCPDQNPGPIALDLVRQIYIEQNPTGNNSLEQCVSRLASGNFSCTDYGFNLYGNNATDYAKPTPIHSVTGNFSDINGILKTPVSGATYTFTGWNTTYTITAASVEAVATRSASATKVSGSVTGSVTGTAINAPSTGAAAPTMSAAALIGLSGLAFALL